MSLREEIQALCENARYASHKLAIASTDEKNKILLTLADKLIEKKEELIAANSADLEEADINGVPLAMVDRLTLSEARIKDIAESLRNIAALDDPIGTGDSWERPSGLHINRIRVPLGVVGIIYEARPNVTVDSAALCIKTGNAVILRGGKEAINTNKALVAVIKETVEECGFDPHAVGLIESTERESANILMSMRGYIDVLIPRGGKGLIKNVVENAKVPIIETGAGNCHIYIDESADIDMAVKVAINAKCSRPSVCNAVETIVVHAAIAAKFLPAFAKEAEPYKLEIRGGARTRVLIPSAKQATEEDYATEYNDFIVAIKVVDTFSDAIKHINRYSTQHSEAIITQNEENAARFCREINSAAVYVNASTRFTDGGEFGFGAEIGISTQKLHVRGPMGLFALTTEKYVVKGDGAVR